MSNIYLAQKLTISGQTITGPLMKNINTLADVISRVLSFLFPLAGVLLFLFLMWGGYDFLLSGGEPEKIQAGRAKITAALIGFLLLIFSLFMVRVIAFTFKLGGGLF